MSIHVFLSTHVGKKTWTKTLLTPNRNSTFTLNIYCSPPPMTATTHTGRISVWPANGRAAATTRWLSWEQQKPPTNPCLWRRFVWVFFLVPTCRKINLVESIYRIICICYHIFTLHLAWLYETNWSITVYHTLILLDSMLNLGMSTKWRIIGLDFTARCFNYFNPLTNV